MPTLNRPNAPNRLPSGDFGDLFYKPRVLRASEGISSVGTPSPLSTPANPFAHRRFRSSESGVQNVSLPVASPSPSIPSRRPLYLDRRSSFWSEGNAQPIVLVRPPRKERSSSFRDAIEEEPIPPRHRISSATSSVSSKAQRTLGISDPRGVQSPDNTVPPRDPRSGFKWKRDFLGGWLEIRIGRQKGLEESHKKSPERTPRNTSRVSTSHTPLSQLPSTAASGAHGSTKALLPDSSDTSGRASTVTPLQEGLYCRTKRALGLKHGPISPYAHPKSRTPTGAILDRVSSTLRFMPQPSFAPSTVSTATDLSIAGARKRRRHSIEYSNSSSVRDLMMGKPPLATPEPEAMYTGSDSHRYLTVELTSDDAPAFLPSEARRINTPPLPMGTPSKGLSRGYFFDYNAPSDKNPSEVHKRVSPSAHNATTSEHDWYRVKLDHIDQPELMTKEELQISVPEHLPNSPLCPKHPKHKSRGTGTCPYHGRNKVSPEETDKTPTQHIRGMPSPVAESWWQK